MTILPAMHLRGYRLALPIRTLPLHLRRRHAAQARGNARADELLVRTQHGEPTSDALVGSDTSSWPARASAPHMATVYVVVYFFLVAEMTLCALLLLPMPQKGTWTSVAPSRRANTHLHAVRRLIFNALTSPLVKHQVRHSLRERDVAHTDLSFGMRRS